MLRRIRPSLQWPVLESVVGRPERRLETGQIDFQRSRYTPSPSPQVSVFLLTRIVVYVCRRHLCGQNGVRFTFGRHPYVGRRRLVLFQVANGLRVSPASISGRPTHVLAALVLAASPPCRQRYRPPIDKFLVRGMPWWLTDLALALFHRAFQDVARDVPDITAHVAVGDGTCPEAVAALIGHGVSRLESGTGAGRA